MPIGSQPFSNGPKDYSLPPTGSCTTVRLDGLWQIDSKQPGQNRTASRAGWTRQHTSFCLPSFRVVKDVFSIVDGFIDCRHRLLLLLTAMVNQLQLPITWFIVIGHALVIFRRVLFFCALCNPGIHRTNRRPPPSSYPYRLRVVGITIVVENFVFTSSPFPIDHRRCGVWSIINDSIFLVWGRKRILIVIHLDEVLSLFTMPSFLCSFYPLLLEKPA